MHIRIIWGLESRFEVIDGCCCLCIGTSSHRPAIVVARCFCADQTIKTQLLDYLGSRSVDG